MKRRRRFRRLIVACSIVGGVVCGYLVLPLALIVLGVSAAERGDNEKARRYLSVAGGLPFRWEATNAAYFLRAHTYAATGEWDKAIADCTEAIAGREQVGARFLSWYWAARGRAYAETGQNDKALADLAIACDAGNAAALSTSTPVSLRKRLPISPSRYRWTPRPLSPGAIVEVRTWTKRLSRKPSWISQSAFV